MTSSRTQFGFGAKILALVLASCITLAVVTSLLAMKENLDVFNNFVDSYRKTLYSDFDTQAKSQVEAAVSMLQRIFERHQKGEFSLDEAKRQGADLLRNMKFGKDGYLWADTTEGVNVAMLGKEIEGKNRYNLQDAKGTYLVQEIIRNGMQPGGGYTNYWFPRPGAPKPFPKRSYSLQFQPFGWVIGTGNYVDDLEAIIKKASDDNRRHLIEGVYLIVGATITLLIVIAIISLVTTKRLIGRLGTEPEQLEEIAKLVAEGDLTVRFDKANGGVYGAMKAMVENLRQIMDMVNKSAHEVSAASVELHANAQNTADGSHEVVSQAETVATASEEMSATSSDIANNCHHAAESSSNASQAAQNGAVIVRNTVEGMNRIADKVRSSAGVVEQLGTRSDQIGAIVATIEDIADQTNLLALNAAIEAARAGEQGRGFAVVADEVRALAERTTKATREIGEMIKSIQGETRLAVSAMEEGVNEVERGTSEAARSGQALEEILSQINEVTGQINQIATAAEEQTATTREISNNIHQISDTVQQSAHSSNEISLASSQLSKLSVELQEMVKRFRL
ncbi:methyl-accepting chemotaxis protein [Geobacter argillaceus]|uniref:Methyl-accepting chemotaxis sensory transducer with Cache sensor n=1 Tax=Geobacter argillaceus TaxID=345631 RepID=A0A562WR14_9BACT|nr:methyl-accepting chemotaxis protein [Geobacter argillaceus]TWJ32793.1 methyl-accepting chemotaxis sensory transducer with Cache sensor [Geobacter argillaceus]